MSLKRDRWLFALTALALFSGLILSIVSWLRLCSGACAESHNWRFFGWPFEALGLLFFIPANLLFWFSRLSPVVGLMIAGALGAEMHLILIQKYQIGAWCPVCLSIASCVALAALCFSIKLFGDKEDHHMLRGIAAISLCAFGFFLSLFGVAKLDPLAAAEATVKESLVFGNKESPIEVYIFTDWACPACRAVEPQIEGMVPKITEKGRLTFVDHAIHRETLNYSPYNVSFMIRNKPEYLKLRDGLTALSLTTGEPTDSQVEKIAEESHTHYVQLNFSDIALSQKYFKTLGRQFGVNQTPTMVVINRDTKRGKKLIGFAQITEENVEKAISSLSTP